MKKFIKSLIPLTLVASSFATVQLTSCAKSTTHLRLTRDDWETKTKTALNQCIATYGVDGKNYSKNNYVVFDFDNTSAIFDIAHQCLNYQIERMAYSLTPTDFEEAISAELGNLDRSLSQHLYDFTYRELINDIVSNYSYLWNKYGPFTYQGVDESKLKDMHQEDDWIDFAAKFRFMFSVVSNVEGDRQRCKWGTYQFSGMTPDEVYDLEYRCLSYYSKIDTYAETWTAKTKIGTSTTIPTSVFYQGISVTENIKELYKVLKDNGIGIWIISASQIDQVLAAADVFGLSQYVSGAFGLTNKIGDRGKYIPQYETYGKGYIREDNKWVKTTASNSNFTSGLGKSLTISELIAPAYNNQGPIMCFGDSTGDFNFCSEFKDTKLVVCFNRADRGVDDGGGLMAALAMYQDYNGITLEQANANNDTLYLLQGRDENGKRSFRPTNETLLLDSNEPRLFKNSANYALLGYIMVNQMSIEDACKLCIKQTVLDISVGFLDSYIGYHAR